MQAMIIRWVGDAEGRRLCEGGRSEGEIRHQGDVNCDGPYIRLRWDIVCSHPVHCFSCRRRPDALGHNWTLMWGYEVRRRCVRRWIKRARKVRIASARCFSQTPQAHNDATRVRHGSQVSEKWCLEPKGARKQV